MPPPLLPRRHRALPAFVIALGICGTVVSFLSTLDHVAFKLGSQAPSLCSAITGSDCAAAHESGAAELLGIPISIFGAAFYLGLVAVALGAWVAGGRAGRVARLLAWGPVALCLAGLGSLGYSVFLASVLVSIGQVCRFCVALYAVNIGVTVAAFAWAWPALRRPREAAPGAVASSALLGGVTLAALAIGVPVYLSAVSLPPAPPPVGVATGSAVPIPDRVPSRGNPAAPATLLEFSDLECPFCATMHETVTELLARNPDRIRVRFVNYPLDTACNCHVSVCLHRTACLAARAGVCAAGAGRFWEYSDLLYRARTRHQRDDLLEYARSAGLDPAAFVACLDAPGTAAALADDIEVATAYGVRATPTIVLNGVKFEGAIDLGRLQELLDRTEVCSCEPSPDDVCSCPGGPSDPDCACGTPVPKAGACGN